MNQISIPHAPFKERIDAYRYFFSRRCFEQAKVALDLLAKSPNRTHRGEIPESYDDPCALSQEDIINLHGFFALYSKPFKQMGDRELKVGLRVGDDLVPPEYAELHKVILALRDKMFAHTDFHDLRDLNGIQANAITVRFSGPRVFPGVQYVKPGLGKIAEYQALLDAMIKTAEWRFQKIWKRWLKKLQMPTDRHDDMWELNTAIDNDAVFIRRPNRLLQ